MCIHIHIITFIMLRGERRRISRFIYFYNLIDNWPKTKIVIIK